MNVEGHQDLLAIAEEVKGYSSIIAFLEDYNEKGS